MFTYVINSHGDLFNATAEIVERGGGLNRGVDKNGNELIELNPEMVTFTRVGVESFNVHFDAPPVENWTPGYQAEYFLTRATKRAAAGGYSLDQIFDVARGQYTVDGLLLSVQRAAAAVDKARLHCKFITMEMAYKRATQPAADPRVEEKETARQDHNDRPYGEIEQRVVHAGFSAFM